MLESLPRSDVYKRQLFYFPLKTGDLLEITLEEEQPSENIIPVCLPLHIIYEDEDLMVIDKPADIDVYKRQVYA